MESGERRGESGEGRAEINHPKWRLLRSEIGIWGKKKRVGDEASPPKMFFFPRLPEAPMLRVFLFVCIVIQNVLAGFQLIYSVL